MAGTRTLQAANLRPVAGAALVAALAVLLAGCSASVGGFERASATDVAPGRFAEVNLELQQGYTIRWDWTADAVMHFNIHTHDDGRYQERHREDTRQSSGSYTAPAVGGYSFLWENTGTTPARLTYNVHGQGKIVSTV